MFPKSRAKFLKYLEHRGLKDTSKQTVYAFLGDGVPGISIAAPWSLSVLSRY